MEALSTVVSSTERSASHRPAHAGDGTGMSSKFLSLRKSSAFRSDSNSVLGPGRLILFFSFFLHAVLRVGGYDNKQYNEMEG